MNCPTIILSTPKSLLFAVGWVVAAMFFVPGAAEAQQLYEGDGQPTAYEEEVRWLLNRARFDRNRENALRGTNYTDVPVSAGPLAPSAALIRAARNHCEDMARRNRFQHETVSGSAFYNPRTHPQPWDRMTAEGYDWDLAGENIAAGYLSAGSVYIGWWKSAGHRKVMGDRFFCEIGMGYVYRASSEFRHYQGMSLGRSWEKRFFTGTIFHDSNNNRAYSSGEGIAGVRVELAVGARLHPDYDVSNSVGSFAIPLEGIAEGEVVQVRLTNTTAQTVYLCVPRTAVALETVTLEAGQSVGWGGFLRTAPLRNHGFRDATIPAAALDLTPGSRQHGPEAVASASVEVGSAVPVTWQARSEVGWLRLVGTDEGQEGEKLVYEVDANPLGELRTGRILFEVDGILQGTFTVMQEGVAPELSLAGGEDEVGVAGGLVDLGVGGNVTWQARTAVHWLRIEGSDRGQAGGSLRVRVGNHAGSQARVGEVVVEGAGMSRRIEIRQSCGGMRSVSEMVSLDVAEGAGQVIGVTGMPVGWRWDAGAQRVVGQVSRPGSYRLRVRVRSESGQVTQHEVVVEVNPLAAHYLGAFEARVETKPDEAAVEMGGMLRFTVAATGAVSGTLDLADRRRVLRGRLEAQPGVAPRLRVAWDAGSPLELALDVELGDNHSVQGQLVANGTGASVTGWRRLWQAQQHPLAEVRVGRSHVLMDLSEAWAGDEAVPQGAGYVVVTVDLAGGVRWAGRLGDGTALSGAGFLGPASQWQAWHAIYARKGAARWFGVWDNAMGLRCQGAWEKRGPSSATDRLYQAGFGRDERGAVGLELEGAKWLPEAMLSALGLGLGQEVVNEAPSWVVTLAEGVLRERQNLPWETKVQVQAQRRVALPPLGNPWQSEHLNLRFNPLTGMVTGGFRLEDPHPLLPGQVIRREVKFHGLWLNPERLAAGYFVGVRLPTAVDAGRALVSGLLVVEREMAAE
jgi:uncharacterized protein YkwD